MLLLDEPFSSLDAELRVRVRSEVAELLSSLSITTVFVTHDQEDAFVVGDSVAVMREGRVLQTGTPAGLYQSPSSAWIAAFVGEANLAAGNASGSSVATKLGNIAIDGTLNGECRVVLRPEHLAIAAGGHGNVVSVEFYGHDTAYTVSIEGERFAARKVSAPVFDVGDSVSLSYDGPPAAAFPVS